MGRFNDDYIETNEEDREYFEDLEKTEMIENKEKIDKIIQACADVFGVYVVDVLGRSRLEHIAAARTASVGLCRDYLKTKNREFGELFGFVPSASSHHKEEFTNRLDYDNKFRTKVIEIRQILKQQGIERIYDK